MATDQKLLLASWLITSAAETPKRDHAVFIEDDRIAGIGPIAEMEARHMDAALVDLRGCAISPGFVDAHRHCYGMLAHGIPTENAPADFWAFLNDFWWGRIEDRLDHDMLRAAMDLSCYDMIRSGVTTFFDCLEAPNAIPGGLFVQGEIVQKWGLRGMLCFEATERVSAENGELGLRENVEFIRACRLPLTPTPLPTGTFRPPGEGLLSGALCHHTTFTCSDAFIQKAHALAKEHEALLHFHCSEGTYEPEQALKKWGRRTIEHYDDLGILDETTLASQCVQLSANEVRIVGERGIRVTTMPLSNCEVGGGFAPVPEMRKAGATVGLGTDGYVANFFASLRGAFLVHKARLLDPGAMPAREVWQMATSDGAKALGLLPSPPAPLPLGEGSKPVGELKVGYAADLIAIDLDLPTPVTVHNLLDQLILWRDQVDVHSVMVAGNWLKRDYLVLDADPEALVAKTREAATRLWAA
jgi:cytosine/adenosine deaminase-related metal-dependent hydrolase